MRTSIIAVNLALFVGLAISSRAWGQTVGYYTFSEGTPGNVATGTGTVLDSSGNGFNGTPVDGPTYSSNVPVTTVPQTGAPDTASMHFSGSNLQSVFIPDNPAFQLTNSLTLEAYFNVAATPNAGGLIIYRGDNRGGLDPYFLTVAPGPTLEFGSYDAANALTSVTTPVPSLNKWYFAAGVLNGATGQMSLYLNGVLQSSITTPNRPLGPLDPTQQPGLAIGALQSTFYGDFESFDGLIDDVRISNTALTPSQFLDATAVPEPASLSVLAISSLGLLARRRKA